jgi:hypothetical protein
MLVDRITVCANTLRARHTDMTTLPTAKAVDEHVWVGEMEVTILQDLFGLSDILEAKIGTVAVIVSSSKRLIVITRGDGHAG